MSARYTSTTGPCSGTGSQTMCEEQEVHIQTSELRNRNTKLIREGSNVIPLPLCGHVVVANIRRISDHEIHLGFRICRPLQEIAFHDLGNRSPQTPGRFCESRVEFNTSNRTNAFRRSSPKKFRDERSRPT